MMRSLVSALLVCYSVAQMSNCLTSSQYTILGDSSTFGCQGYANSVTVSWTLNSTDSRLLTFTAFNTENNYDKVTVTQGSAQWGPFSGTTNPGSIMLLPGMASVVFTSDASNTDPGFTIVMTTAPDIVTLQSSQQVTVQPKQDGGFVYFALASESYGSDFIVNTLIHAYQGLQPPSMFVGWNRLPTLENYDYTNQTIPYGDGYQAFLFVNQPRDGTYYIGLFLYGTSTDIDISASWAFSVMELVSGQQVTNTTGAAPVLFQVNVPTATSQLVWQISRQVPGGYPIAYISAGSIPTPTNYQYVMDTSQQSYQKLVINNPNPYYNQAPNPGNFLIAVYEKASLEQRTLEVVSASAEEKAKFEQESFQPLSAGFIMQVNWNF